MKVKVMPLIFMVVFAVIATSVVLHFSSSQIAQENFDFGKSYNTLQIDNDDQVGVEPLKEIDTPEMPG